MRKGPKADVGEQSEGGQRILLEGAIRDRPVRGQRSCSVVL
jgi:hypothetical protein